MSNPYAQRFKAHKMRVVSDLERALADKVGLQIIDPDVMEHGLKIKFGELEFGTPSAINNSVSVLESEIRATLSENNA